MIGDNDLAPLGRPLAPFEREARDCSLEKAIKHQGRLMTPRKTPHVQ
jgi:hypothetical protein